MDVDDVFAMNTVITGFKNGANYTMSIVTTSNDPNTLPSTQTESNFIQLGIFHYHIVDLVLGVQHLRMCSKSVGI